jgi:hypothetical protein
MQEILDFLSRTPTFLSANFSTVVGDHDPSAKFFVYAALKASIKMRNDITKEEALEIRGLCKAVNDEDGAITRKSSAVLKQASLSTGKLQALQAHHAKQEAKKKKTTMKMKGPWKGSGLDTGASGSAVSTATSNGAVTAAEGDAGTNGADAASATTALLPADRDMYARLFASSADRVYMRLRELSNSSTATSAGGSLSKLGTRSKASFSHAIRKIGVVAAVAVAAAPAAGEHAVGSGVAKGRKLSAMAGRMSGWLHGDVGGGADAGVGTSGAGAGPSASAAATAPSPPTGPQEGEKVNVTSMESFLS